MIKNGRWTRAQDGLIWDFLHANPLETGVGVAIIMHPTVPQFTVHSLTKLLLPSKVLDATESVPGLDLASSPCLLIREPQTKAFKDLSECCVMVLLVRNQGLLRCGFSWLCLMAEDWDG